MNTNHAQVSAKPLRKLGPGDDAEMITHPEYWPWQVVLPLTNNKMPCPFTDAATGLPGMIFIDDPTTVLIGLLALPLGTVMLTGQVFRYSSVEEMLNSGWRVD